MSRFIEKNLPVITAGFFLFLCCFSVPFLIAQQKDKPERYTYVRRNDAKEGDYKAVVVPATNKRQAMLDAQTYHIGWDAVDAWMGQSRVMFCVLLKKRAPYVPGQAPVMRRIPKASTGT